jgi:hypothetical protein
VLAPNGTVVLAPKEPVAALLFVFEFPKAVLVAPPPKSPALPNVDLFALPNVLFDVPPKAVLDGVPKAPPKVLLVVAVVPPKRPPADVEAPKVDLLAPNGEVVLFDPNPMCDLLAKSDFFRDVEQVLPPKPAVELLLLLVLLPKTPPVPVLFDVDPNPAFPVPNPPEVAVVPKPNDEEVVLLLEPKRLPPKPPPKDMLEEHKD